MKNNPLMKYSEESAEQFIDDFGIESIKIKTSNIPKKTDALKISDSSLPKPIVQNSVITNITFRLVAVMKRELGIARCGLACCLCSENDTCNGCYSGNCPDNDWCENKKCSQDKGLEHCYECAENCTKGLLSKIKPYTFNFFIKQYGEEKLLDCLERNEKNGVVYHRDGVNGDYDCFTDTDSLINFILNGK